MNDLNYLKDNIMSRRWKTKYEQCSQAVRDKLDKLDEMYINEYQLQVIKRKRIYPDIGDIFKICPRENIECYGIVVNNHVNNKNGDDFIVIFVFKSDVDIEQSVKKGIRKEDLLIDPEIVGKEYSIGKRKFFDEYGNDIQEEPSILGTYGVATISGVAYSINQELIIAGII